jgi:hypothetical protein
MPRQFSHAGALSASSSARPRRSPARAGDGAPGELILLRVATRDRVPRNAVGSSAPTGRGTSGCPRPGLPGERELGRESSRPLVAAVVQAADSHPDEAIRLSAELTPILDRAWVVADWVTVATAAVQASHHASDRVFAAVAWGTLGLALRAVRRFDEAIDAHQQALDIHRETGDRHGEGQAWNNLGNALQEVRRFDEAIAAHKQALDIHRESGDRHDEGLAWGNLGIAHAELDQPDRARQAWRGWETTSVPPRPGSGWPTWTGSHRKGQTPRLTDRAPHTGPTSMRTELARSTMVGSTTRATARRRARVHHQVTFLQPGAEAYTFTFG